KRAEEPFVWDATNIIVDFHSTEIFQALKEAESSIDNMAPESLVSLVLGLETVGRSIFPYGDDILWDFIHPTINKVSRSRFESAHYADSVEAAFKEINSIIKAKV